MVAVDFTGKYCLAFKLCLSLGSSIGTYRLKYSLNKFLTASNGSPRDPSSLHYIDPYGRLNSYQQVFISLRSVFSPETHVGS